MKNHLNIIIRNLIRKPFLSFINVLCLATGMLTVIFIFLWIQDELKYDKFHPGYENIYRLTIKVDNNEAGYHSHFARSYYPWLYKIKDKVPGIENICRLNFMKHFIVMNPSEEAFRAEIIFSDQSVFDVFWFKFLKGSQKDAFAEPKSIVLSKSAAEKYFGTKDPIGQTLKIYCDRCVEKELYTITGVIEDYPATSHFHCDIIGNISDPDNFSDWAYYYLKLDKNTNPQSVIENFPAFASGFVSLDEIKTLTPYIQPVSDIHLRSEKDREISENGNYKNIWLFMGLSFFVLFIALFNFINVRQVYLLRSHKTISILHIHGASWWKLFIMQMTESFLISLISLVFGIVIVLLSLPSFNVFTGKTVSFSDLGQIWFIPAGLLILSGFAGVYPFLYSGLRKRLFNSNRGNINQNFSLIKRMKYAKYSISIQFALSLILIIMVVVVNFQLAYFMNNKLGKGDKNILCIENIPVQILNKYQVFRSELLKSPDIIDVTCSFENPADENMDMMEFETTNISDEIKNKHLFVYPAGDNFFDFYDIKLIAGSGFPPYYGNDSISETYILNKKACDFLGWKPEEAIDKPFSLVFHDPSLKIFYGGRISGVVEDFQMSSMKNEIKPYVFFQKSFWMEAVQLKFKEGKEKSAMAATRECYERVFPGYPMRYHFLEDLYLRIYKSEFQLKTLSFLLGVIAVFLSMIGLYGITGIIYQAKTKEIGMRKVNGATKNEIVTWLLRDINQIIAIAILLGLPLSFILMSQWLINFPLRIYLKPFMFVYPSLILYLVSIATVIARANKAANTNPAESLKFE